MRHLAAVALPFFTLTCASATEPVAHNDPAAAGATTPLAIVNATVLPMDREVALQRQTIIVRDGRIVEMSTTASIPAGATVVQANGRFVMPGLVDMHVHVTDTLELNAYLNAGVTTVRNLWGFASIKKWGAEIAAGTRVGPTLVSTSPGVDAPPSQWPGPQLLVDPRHADSIVSKLATDGWQWIKVYAQLTLPAYDALVVAARARNIPLIGHVPLAVPVQHAIASGQREIQHLTGYDIAVSARGRAGTWGWSDAVPARFAALVTATAAAKTWNCPTLVIYSELGKQHSPAERTAMLQYRRQFVKALADAGAPLLVGTDAGIGIVAPGTSIHDELREFVAAGLTPAHVLRVATLGAAEALGRTDVGIVAAGAVADLILLDADPRSEIENTRRLSGVVSRGAWRPVTR